MELIVHFCKKHKDNTLSSRAIEQIYISVLLCNLVLFFGYGTEKQTLYWVINNLISHVVWGIESYR